MQCKGPPQRAALQAHGGEPRIEEHGHSHSHMDTKTQPRAPQNGHHPSRQLAHTSRQLTQASSKTRRKQHALALWRGGGARARAAPTRMPILRSVVGPATRVQPHHLRQGCTGGIPRAPRRDTRPHTEPAAPEPPAPAGRGQGPAQRRGLGVLDGRCLLRSLQRGLQVRPLRGPRRLAGSQAALHPGTLRHAGLQLLLGRLQAGDLLPQGPHGGAPGVDGGGGEGTGRAVGWAQGGGGRRVSVCRHRGRWPSDAGGRGVRAMTGAPTRTGAGTAAATAQRTDCDSNTPTGRVCVRVCKTRTPPSLRAYGQWSVEGHTRRCCTRAPVAPSPTTHPPTHTHGHGPGTRLCQHARRHEHAPLFVLARNPPPQRRQLLLQPADVRSVVSSHPLLCVLRHRGANTKQSQRTHKLAQKLTQQTLARTAHTNRHTGTSTLAHIHTLTHRPRATHST
jgi:hypothetical protein